MDRYYLPSLEDLTEHFESLPGVGKKSAQKMAYSILKMSDEKVFSFAQSMMKAKNNIKRCKECCNFTDKDICDICSNSSRDKSIICVVEEPKDVSAIERTNEFNALYHVLHGVISPLNGIGPDEICIKELLKRIEKEEIKEVIMATNPTVEGEATAMYISKILKPLGIKVTRLAYGVPVGASLEYADEITLSRAMLGRNEIL